MKTTSHTQAFFAGALRAALLLALFGAGWSVYRRLPPDEAPVFDDATQTSQTMLRIVLRRTGESSMPAGELPFQLYSINVAAAQREYFAERREGVRLEDFMARRMKGRPVIEGRLDETGQAIVAVPPGTWWIHATQTGAEEVTWRLRVNVAGREQTVELTPTNAYVRARSF